MRYAINATGVVPVTREEGWSLVLYELFCLNPLKRAGFSRLPVLLFIKGGSGLENQTSKIPVRLQLQNQEYQHRLTDFLKTYGKEQVVIQESPANSGVLLSDQDGEATGELVLRLSFEDMTKEGEISAYQKATDLLALIRSRWGQNQQSIVRTYAPVKDTGPSAIAQEAPDYGIVKPFGRLTGVFSPVGGCGKTTFAGSIQ